MSTTPGVSFRKDGTKTFIPLENNPEVFTKLIHNLGVSEKLGFYDVYSIDEPELLAMIPRPVHALVFITPAPMWARVRENDPGSKELSYDGSGPDEPVVWYKQTIGHACGLIALLHSVSNGTAKSFINTNSILDKILKETQDLKPLQRANHLYNSIELEKAHMATAVTGDTIAPASEEPSGYHFISFVKGQDGHLYDLEGGWGGPVDCGTLDDGEDLLSNKALEVTVKRFTKAAEGNLEFSIIALATVPDGA
ncbi:probable ubiquitin thiolesterase L3 [Fusarium oxysporum]|uniref:Ubiquitin carboxyl-terminal hydrolase n=1 Tax=Fusarium oxysporum TaxID=5507 RepID=A0A2H3TPI7_FUSOX|nr:probable ubiquitin thiolesterase L3 [Fusarium oxysporum]